MRNKVAAFGWALMWTLTFSIAMTFGKLLPKSIATGSIVFFRSVFGFLAILPIIISEGLEWPKAKNWKLHLVRLSCISLAIFATYYAYRTLPLICATVLGFSGPLFTVVLARIILRNPVSRNRWIALFIGYAGVLVALGVTFKSSSVAGIAASILANFFVGIGIVVTRVLTKDEPRLTLLTLPTVVNAIMFMPSAVSSGACIAKPEMLKLLGIGFFGMGSQFCYVSALKLARPSFLAPLEYIRFIFSSIIGILIFGEVLTVRLVLGLVMIASGAIFLAKTEDL